MPHLIDKARLGRSSALADLAKSICRTSREGGLRSAANVMFVSTRASTEPHPACVKPERAESKPRWSAADLFSPLWANYGARVH